MPMTDNPDTNDFDQQEESLELEQSAARPNHEPNFGGNPNLKLFEFPKMLAGCGCFGCSSLVILLGFGFLLTIVLGFLLPNWKASGYALGTCLVLEKRLDSHEFSPLEKKKESYRPAVHIQYEVNGREFKVWTYDTVRSYSDNRDANQAILDNIELGKTYPCWYDPDQPDQAILVQSEIWGAYVALIIPIGFWIIGTLGLLFAWKITSVQPIRVEFGDPSMTTPSGPKFLP